MMQLLTWQIVQPPGDLRQQIAHFIESLLTEGGICDARRMSGRYRD